MMEAVLSNADHPEYGVVTIPFPIPREQFDHCIELVEALEVGNASAKDCNVDEIRSAWPVLNRLEGKVINLDELDYLAKRLDSFDVGEAAQFQAMAHKLELFELKDLINLTFCCQQATVITDFSDLEAIGRDHYMNLHGGCASTQELENLDGAETARLLIDSGAGEVTPYGVVYDNGMKLEQLYDGKHSLKPALNHQAECRSAKVEKETVRIPARRNCINSPFSEQSSVNPRLSPCRRRSAAVPPWPTTPVRIPYCPVISDARDGRQGALGQ